MAAGDRCRGRRGRAAHRRPRRHQRRAGHVEHSELLVSPARRAHTGADRRHPHGHRPGRGRPPHIYERLIMAWDFETDPEYQVKLDWVAEFVRTEVEPLDLLYPNPYDRNDPEIRALMKPLQEKVKA